MRGVNESYTGLAKQQIELFFVLNQYFSKAIIPLYLYKRYNSLSLVFSASITLDSKDMRSLVEAKNASYSRL